MDLRNASYASAFNHRPASAYEVDTLVFGKDLEEDRTDASVAALPGAKAVSLHLVEADMIEVDEGATGFSLHETAEIEAFLESLIGRIALDITGLEHKVWAPLVRGLLATARDVLVLYAEPEDYQKSQEPLPGAIYDLSSRIRGIEPLPGFAKISNRVQDEGFFAPLLGFEGPRLDHVIDQEEVDLRHTYPIVGFPGFRLEYPAYAYLAHRSVLIEEFVHSRVELARASDPFEAFEALTRVLERAGHGHLRVAPLGTKPHALGAVLFAIAHPASVELIYDHPVRSSNRTHGVREIHVYEVSDFMASWRLRS